MSETLEAAKTEIAVVNVTALVPTKVFAPGGVDEILTKLEAEARATAATLDVSAPKGRKEIASLAYKVARSKTALDDMGKDLVADIKAKAALIDADRRVVRDRLDKLRDDVRRPLDEFEAAEEKRVEQHEAGIAAFSIAAPGTTEEIAKTLAMVEATPTDGFQEFAKRAAEAKEAAVIRLRSALLESQQRDAERAELERLRQEAAERAAREEAERIEREKQEAADRAAEQARRDAEEKARQEREEAERAATAERERIEREAQAERERAAAEQARVEREKAEAEERAAQAERDRLDAERRAKEAEERAERDRIEAERRAEEDRKAAEERARQREEEAARRERQRVEDERKAEEEAQRRREEDRAHRGSINRAAMNALVAAGLSEGAARTAVEAIAKGEVPCVRISY
ncbi:hypothetical protein Sp245p_26420 (plasmid) [Azospirillum baldaniorum]|uniref:Phage-related protein n=1 Tax=Azospirillum baldaniorum TaxID=1064539 RepID=A0A9P1NRD3_9PROT|nr:hypothetical protein [Azospirillum baldaniorum]AWJ93264.1 hypothetical protein Sp245p_25920 [Azospirillum baldaniorum]AWJ93359.1 hypothetical protein Sp245p_26420 [Azospirillum baldaniorum]TWA77958.1 hypothetical protein FBZ85_106118 [Azospirillum brasilense]CCD02942.1 phage-related protein [Azospirillum baldaniorum]